MLHLELVLLSPWEEIMLSLLNGTVKDPSVFRRLEFAATFYPKSMPKYWERLAPFSVKGGEGINSISPEQTQQIIENIQVLDCGALATDTDLMKDIIVGETIGRSSLLGIVLILDRQSCPKCQSKLYFRADRTANVIVYDDNLGTMPGTHYTKYCQRPGCCFQQHYGYNTHGKTNEVVYGADWSTLPYFLSTRETAFSMDFLSRLDSEILIGQLSYKQKADIYNDVHGSENATTAVGAR